MPRRLRLLIGASTRQCLDVRLTVSDVLLARRGLKTADLKLSNPLSGTYSISLTLPTPVGAIPFLSRQWASVDVKIRGKSFRFITTHLEAFEPRVRVAQAQELLAGPAATSLPTIVVGDFNSQPGFYLAYQRRRRDDCCRLHRCVGGGESGRSRLHLLPGRRSA